MTDPRTEGQSPRAGSSFDIIEILVLGLGRHIPWILGFAIVGLGIGAFLSISVPNRYQSSGKFLVKFGTLEKQTPESVAGIRDTRQYSHSIADEIQILSSDLLFKQVAKELGPKYIMMPPADPTANDGPTTPFLKRKMHEIQRWLWFGSKGPQTTLEGEEEIAEEEMDSPKAIAAAATRLMLGTRFAAGQQTSILSVEYKDTTPERAQTICQKIMEMCQWRHTQVFSGMLSPQYLDVHLESALREEDVSSDQFHQHTEECGFFDLVGRKGEVLQTISNLEETIADDELRMKEIEKELERIELDLVGIEPKIVELFVPAPAPNPQWELMTRRVQEEERKLEQLSLEFRAESEAYRTRKAGIESVIKVLSEQLEGLERYSQPDPYDKPIDNPRYVSLVDEKSKLERERERRLTGRDARIERLAGKRLELQAILDCEPIHRAMQGEVAQARGRVGQLSQAKQSNETMLALAAEKEASNLVIFQEARYIPMKVAPKRSKNVLTGLGAGFAAGAGFAVLRQFLDSRLRFPRTAKRVVGVKVLGVVPEVRTWRRVGNLLRKGHAA